MTIVASLTYFFSKFNDTIKTKIEINKVRSNKFLRFFLTTKIKKRKSPISRKLIIELTLFNIKFLNYFYSKCIY